MKKELSYFDSKEVWELQPVSEALAVTGKPPVTVRWVLVNKGDNQRPNIQARAPDDLRDIFATEANRRSYLAAELESPSGLRDGSHDRMGF